MYELKHILVGIDHRDDLGQAGEQGRMLARAFGATVHPLHFCEAATGSASDYVESAGRRVAADLIIIDGGNRTSLEVVRLADCPVLTIPPAARTWHETAEP